MAASQVALPTSSPWGNQQYSSPYQGQTTNPNNPPVNPTYNMPWNSGMAEAPVMAGLLNGVQYNQQPLTNLENYASDPNASPWAQASTQQSYNQQNQAQSNMAGTNAGATAATEGGLAMQGGLSSGARERAQETGQQGLLAGDQNIASQGMQQRGQININDASNKLQAQEALPGMETQAYQAQLEPIQLYGQAYGQDVANQINATNGLNQFNLGMYNTQGQMYGANNQGNAIQNAQQQADNTSGLFGGGGFLGMGFSL